MQKNKNKTKQKKKQQQQQQQQQQLNMPQNHPVAKGMNCMIRNSVDGSCGYRWVKCTFAESNQFDLQLRTKNFHLSPIYHM